jgi:NAD(P)-dependent dehydrogenase (short-subunit alcohol dehydrogenase family)
MSTSTEPPSLAPFPTNSSPFRRQLTPDAPVFNLFQPNIQLTKTLAMSWAEDHIRANAIAAGFIATPMTQAMVDAVELSAAPLARTPAGRWDQPGDIAPTVLFLASKEASFITGQTLAVDGGLSIAG